MWVQDRQANRALNGADCVRLLMLRMLTAPCSERTCGATIIILRRICRIICTVQRRDVDLLSARCVAVSLEQFGRFWSSVSSTFWLDLPLACRLFRFPLVRSVVVACCAWSCSYATMPKLSQQSGVSVQCVTRVCSNRHQKH